MGKRIKPAEILLKPLKNRDNFTEKSKLFYNNEVQLLFLVVISLIVYFPVFSNQFQDFWDDQWVAVNHYTEAGINLDNILKILTEFYHGQYAPVNQLFYTSLHSAFGYDPFWFHSVCLFIHIANVILVFFFIKQLLSQTKSFELSSTQRIAFFTALLFAIHPFLVEAVAWIAASKIILYAFFYLIALHFYLKFTVNTQIRYYLLVILLFIISFGAKEQAVTLPVCLLLIDYALKRNLKDLQVWLEKLPFFILSVFFGIITMLSQAETGEGALSDVLIYPFYQNIIFASYSLIEYLIKCLLPYKLTYLYPFPNVVGDPVPLRFWIYPFVILFVTISLWSFWRRPWVFFGMAFFIIHLGVALHIIPISRFAIVADRYVYIASIGIFLGMSWLLDQAICRKYKYLNVIVIFSILYIFSLSIYTYQRSKVWYDTDTLKKEIRQLLKLRKDYNPNH